MHGGSACKLLAPSRTSSSLEHIDRDLGSVLRRLPESISFCRWTQFPEGGVRAFRLWIATQCEGEGDVQEHTHLFPQEAGQSNYQSELTTVASAVPRLMRTQSCGCSERRPCPTTPKSPGKAHGRSCCWRRRGSSSSAVLKNWTANLGDHHH